MFLWKRAKCVNKSSSYIATFLSRLLMSVSKGFFAWAVMRQRWALLYSCSSRYAWQDDITQNNGHIVIWSACLHPEGEGKAAHCWQGPSLQTGHLVPDNYDCTINHNLNSNRHGISFLNDSDWPACISLCIQITLHSCVLLFTSQQSQMLYQSHSHSVKQNTQLIRQSG